MTDTSPSHQELCQEIASLKARIHELESKSERKHLVESFRESDNWLATIIRGTHALLVSVNLNGRFTYVNDATAKALGYATPEELIGKSYLHFIHLDDRQRVLDAYTKQIEGRHPSCMQEFRIIDTAGQIKWFSFLSSLTITDGEVVGQSGVAQDISERRRAEERLHLLAQVTAASSDYIVVIGADYRYRFANDIYLQARQLRPVDIIGHHMIEIVGAEKFEQLGRPQVAAGLRGESVESFEWTDFGGNDQHYLHVRVEPFHEADGTITGVVMTGRDITARKRSEEQLQKHTDRLRFALSAARQSWFETIVPTGEISVGPEYPRLLGYEPEEFVSNVQNWFDNIHPDDRANVQRVFQQVLQSSGPCEVEYRRRTRFDEWKWMYTTGAVVERDTAGKPYRLTGVHMDIAERKRVEEELKQSEERFRGMLQNVATVAVQGYALDGTVRYWNHASESFYGYAAEEVLGGNLLDLIIPPAMRGEVSEAIRHMANTGEPIPSGELVLMRKNGSPITVYSSHAIVKVAGKEPELFCIDVDLSASRQAEAEKEKLQVQLTQAQKMESVGRLAGGGAHDFNNMLGVILGYAEMAMDRIDPDDPLFAALREIRKAAERSSDLTRQLLAFARKQVVAPKVLDLNETVENSLKMLHRLIGENIELIWLPGQALAPVFFDSSQFDQILANLCVNARDAITGNGKITFQTANCTLGQEHCTQRTGFVPGQYVLMAVSDNGSGMDKDMLAQIFEPFFTTKELGKGTGLGLAMVYGAVKQNHGFIDVDSQPGEGTTFKIYLPAHTVITSSRPEADQAQASVATGKTILLVEDEPAILTMTTLMLERLGYTVIAAGTSGEAIRFARDHKGNIDLLLTDVIMPEMNGRDLARNLMSLYPGLKCLFMSGYTADVIADHGVLEEGVLFVQKPFGGQDLAARLAETLGD